MSKLQKTHEKELLLGVHLSTSQGIKKFFEEAERLKINVFQFFLGSPRVWKNKIYSKDEINLFLSKKLDYKFICVHAPYLLNFASNNSNLYEKSIERAVSDVKEMQKLGVENYVFHPGSSQDTERGIKLIKEAIHRIMDFSKNVNLIVENTAGEKNDIGKDLDELAEIVEGFNDKLGICIDTCHLFASGTDIRQYEQVEFLYFRLKSLNLDKRLKVIHSNDSKFNVESKKDRHAHISEGFIGEKGFLNLFKHPFFSKLPYILETPKENNMDEVNLGRLKKLFYSI